MTAARLLTEDEAAEYLHIPVAAVVREGIGRVRFGRHTRYDRRALDAHLDALSGLTPHGSVANDDSADAALDRFVQSRPERSA